MFHIYFFIYINGINFFYVYIIIHFMYKLSFILSSFHRYSGYFNLLILISSITTNISIQVSGLGPVFKILIPLLRTRVPQSYFNYTLNILDTTTLLSKLKSSFYIYTSHVQDFWFLHVLSSIF